MPIIWTDVSHRLTAIPFDLRMFTLALDTASYFRSASFMMGMSAGDVTKIVTSSAYAMTFAFGPLDAIRIPVSLSSRVHRRGLRHMAKSIMLNGHP